MPCARGGQTATGELCPYTEHLPQSLEGWQAWDLTLKGSGQIRFCQLVPIGIDLAPLMQLGDALGYEPTALAELLPACETGLIGALQEKLKD